MRSGDPAMYFQYRPDGGPPPKETLLNAQMSQQSGIDPSAPNRQFTGGQSYTQSLQSSANPGAFTHPGSMPALHNMSTSLTLQNMSNSLASRAPAFSHGAPSAMPQHAGALPGLFAQGPVGVPGSLQQQGAQPPGMSIAGRALMGGQTFLVGSSGLPGGSAGGLSLGQSMAALQPSASLGMGLAGPGTGLGAAQQQQQQQQQQALGGVGMGGSSLGIGGTSSSAGRQLVAGGAGLQGAPASAVNPSRAVNGLEDQAGVQQQMQGLQGFQQQQQQGQLLLGQQDNRFGSQAGREGETLQHLQGSFGAAGSVGVRGSETGQAGAGHVSMAGALKDGLSAVPWAGGLQGLQGKRAGDVGRGQGGGFLPGEGDKGLWGTAEQARGLDARQAQQQQPQQQQGGGGLGVALDASEFPSLSGGQAAGSLPGLFPNGRRSVPPLSSTAAAAAAAAAGGALRQPSPFTMQKEDFPALSRMPGQADGEGSSNRDVLQQGEEEGEAGGKEGGEEKEAHDHHGSQDKGKLAGNWGKDREHKEANRQEHDKHPAHLVHRVTEGREGREGSREGPGAGMGGGKEEDDRSGGERDGPGLGQGGVDKEGRGKALGQAGHNSSGVAPGMGLSRLDEGQQQQQQLGLSPGPQSAHTSPQPMLRQLRNPMLQQQYQQRQLQEQQRLQAQQQLLQVGQEGAAEGTGASAGEWPQPQLSQLQMPAGPNQALLQSTGVMPGAQGGGQGGLGGAGLAAAGSAGAGAELDRFGLMGLLAVIRMSEPDLTTLALGTDLTTLGLNLNSRENLYKTFASPWAEGPARAEPEFTLPQCYIQPAPRLQRAYFSKFQQDTLFYVFYSCARGWFFHKEHGMWLARVPNVDLLVKAPTFERGSYLFFDPSVWEIGRKENFQLNYDMIEPRPLLPQPQPLPPFTSPQPLQR